MKLGYRKSTGEVIGDFQEKATEEVLLGNAIRAGIPENDIEVREVSIEEYSAELEKVQERGRVEAEDQAAQRRSLAISVKSKLKTTLKLTDQEITLLFPFL